MEKQIANLKKQNEGMKASFKAKNIKFTKLHINNVDPDLKLTLLTDYNTYLKGISAANRPVKEEKPKPKDTAKLSESRPKEPKEPKADDDEDECLKDVKPSYSTIAKP